MTDDDDFEMIRGTGNVYADLGMKEPEQRQLRAILASGSRKPRLHQVTAPTLVIHGKVDPLVHHAAGTDTAESIPNAKLLMIEKMGHAIPTPTWPQIIDAIAKHAHGANAQAA